MRRITVRTNLFLARFSLPVAEGADRTARASGMRPTRSEMRASRTVVLLVLLTLAVHAIPLDRGGADEKLIAPPATRSLATEDRPAARVCRGLR